MNNKQIEFVKKVYPAAERLAKAGGVSRSEEHTSELQSR